MFPLYDGTASDAEGESSEEEADTAEQGTPNVKMVTDADLGSLPGSQLRIIRIRLGIQMCKGMSNHQVSHHSQRWNSKMICAPSTEADIARNDDGSGAERDCLIRRYNRKLHEELDQLLP